jgi:hypothetical protein
MASEILAALGGSAGMGAMWAIQHFITSQNGNGKLSKKDYETSNDQMQTRLDAGDKRFENFDKRIDLIFDLLRCVTTKIDRLDGFVRGKEEKNEIL